MISSIKAWVVIFTLVSLPLTAMANTDLGSIKIETDGNIVITDGNICIGNCTFQPPVLPPGNFGPTLNINNEFQTVNLNATAIATPTTLAVVNTITGNYGSNVNPQSPTANMAITSTTCGNSGVEMVTKNSCIDYSALNNPTQATMLLMLVGPEVIIEEN